MDEKNIELKPCRIYLQFPILLYPKADCQRRLYEKIGHSFFIERWAQLTSTAALRRDNHVNEETINNLLFSPEEVTQVIVLSILLIIMYLVQQKMN